MGKIFDKFMNTMRLNGDDYEEEYDEFDDAEFDDEYEEPAVKPQKTVKTIASESTPVRERTAKTQKASSRSGKIVSINKNTQNIQEVRVIRPTNYNSATEIIDVILDGQACIVNLEGISFDLAAQITDFIFGGCYALDGNIEKVNNYIFIMTPHDLEITGDIQNFVKGATATDSVANGFK